LRGHFQSNKGHASIRIFGCLNIKDAELNLEQFESIVLGVMMLGTQRKGRENDFGERGDTTLKGTFDGLGVGKSYLSIDGKCAKHVAVFQSNLSERKILHLGVVRGV